MKLFGLELELFYGARTGTTPSIRVPPHRGDMPVDGFAGLVEIRSRVSADPYECYGDVLQKIQKIEDMFYCDLILAPQHKFCAEELQRIRGNEFAPTKDRQVFINNLYGKKTRLLPAGVALASLQINFSDQLAPSTRDKEGIERPARYGLLDIPYIVRKLDENYRTAIAATKRQEGFYAVKDGYRLEYRSAPNIVFDKYLPKFLTSFR